MTDYTRGTIWADGQDLTAAALNAEFDRIAKAINEGAAASGEGDTTIINAGAARFDTGGLEAAERVQNAVAEAVAGDIKVVFVPRTMWGYVDDTAWAPGIFDTGVLVVREGQRKAGHDPVAYGAKPDDAAVDDQPAFDVCYTQAAASGFLANPGAARVDVTLPGEYQLDADVTRDNSIAVYQGPGVTYAGTGTHIDHTTEPGGGFIAIEDLNHMKIVGTVDHTVPSTSEQASNFKIIGTAVDSVIPNVDLDTWYPLSVKLEVNPEGEGYDATRMYGLGTYLSGTSPRGIITNSATGLASHWIRSVTGGDEGSGEESFFVSAKGHNPNGTDMDFVYRWTVWFTRLPRL